MAFNLTAQLNLQGPTNIKQIASQIKKDLGNIDATIQFKLDPNVAKNVAALSSSLKTLNSTFANTVTSATAASSAIKSFGNSINSVKINNIPQKINATSSAITSLNKESTESVKALAGASSELVEFGKQAGLAVRRFVAFSAVTSIIYGVTNSINNGVQAFIDYDKELVKLQQVTGESASGLSKLQSQITDLSVAYGVSSKELTSVASTLAQAGLSARETEKALKALALSSLAPSFDGMNETVEGSIALMRQFGISAEDLEASLGSVNTVAARFAVESKDIITAIQRTGSVFATASKGVSEGKDALNEFISIFTSVRATTRESAETIATGLRTIFTRIQRGTTIDALKEFGVNLTDAEGKFVGAYKAVELLSNGLSKLDPRSLDFSRIVEELGGFRQIGKVIPLIQQFAVTQEALKVAQRGQGSLARDAATAQLSLANQISKVKEEFFALFREIGQSKGFQTLIRGALTLTSGLIKLTDSLKGILPALAVIAAFKGAKGLTQFIGGFNTGIKRGPDGKANGGVIKKFARGGVVPGSGSGDTVPAMLEPGEFVIRKKAVETIGADNLHSMNKYGGGGSIRAGKSNKRKRFGGGGKLYDDIDVQEYSKSNKQYAGKLKAYDADSINLLVDPTQELVDRKYTKPDRKTLIYPTDKVTKGVLVPSRLEGIDAFEIRASIKERKEYASQGGKGPAYDSNRQKGKIAKDITIDFISGLGKENLAKIFMEANKVDYYGRPMAEIGALNQKLVGANVAKYSGTKKGQDIIQADKLANRLEIMKKNSGFGNTNESSWDRVIKDDYMFNYMPEKSKDRFNSLGNIRQNEARLLKTIKDSDFTKKMTETKGLAKFMAGGKAESTPFGTGQTKFPKRITSAYAKELQQKLDKETVDNVWYPYPSNERIAIDPSEVAQQFQNEPFDRKRFLSLFNTKISRNELVGNLSDFAKFIGLPGEDLAKVLPQTIDFGGELQRSGNRGTFSRDPFGTQGYDNKGLGSFGFTESDEQDLFGYQKLMDEKTKEIKKILKTPIETFDDGSFSYDTAAFTKAMDDKSSLGKKISDVMDKKAIARKGLMEQKKGILDSTGRGFVSMASNAFEKNQPKNVLYHELTHQLLNSLRTKSEDSFTKYKERVSQLFNGDNDDLADSFDALGGSYNSADVVYGRSYKNGLLDNVLQDLRRKTMDAGGRSADPDLSKEAYSMWVESGQKKNAREYRPINPKINDLLLKGGQKQETLDKVEDYGKEEFLTTLVQNAPKLDSNMQGILDSTLNELLGNSGIERQKFMAGGQVELIKRAGVGYSVDDVAAAAQRNGMTFEQLKDKLEERGTTGWKDYVMPEPEIRKLGLAPYRPESKVLDAVISAQMAKSDRISNWKRSKGMLDKDYEGQTSEQKEFLASRNLGYRKRYAAGGQVTRNIGVIDTDVLRDPANAGIVGSEMEKLGISSVSEYSRELAKLAAQARKEQSLSKLTAIAGAAGSGKSSLAMGRGAPDNATLRKTVRSPILTPEDIAKVNEVTVLTSTASQEKLDAYLKDVDRAYILSSSTREEQDRVGSNRQQRDLTGEGLYGRKPGITNAATRDFTLDESILRDELGKKATVLGRKSGSFGLRRKQESELSEIVQAGGYYTGGFAPPTRGHRGAFDTLLSNMISRNPNASAEDIIVSVAPNLSMDRGEGKTKEEQLAHAARYGIFPADFRALLAGINFPGGMISAESTGRGDVLPKMMEVQGDNGRRKFAKLKGALAITSGKKAGALQKYEKAGVDVTDIPRIEDISATNVRQAVIDGDDKALTSFVSPEIASVLMGNRAQLRNRSMMVPMLIEEITKYGATQKANTNAEIQQLLANAPGGPYGKITQKARDNAPDVVAQVEDMRAKRDALSEGLLGYRAHNIISLLSAKYPDAYGLDPSRRASVSAQPSDLAKDIIASQLSEGMAGEFGGVSTAMPSGLQEAILKNVEKATQVQKSSGILPTQGSEILKRFGAQRLPNDPSFGPFSGKTVRETSDGGKLKYWQTSLPPATNPEKQAYYFATRDYLIDKFNQSQGNKQTQTLADTTNAVLSSKQLGLVGLNPLGYTGLLGPETWNLGTDSSGQERSIDASIVQRGLPTQYQNVIDYLSGQTEEIVGGASKLLGIEPKKLTKKQRETLGQGNIEGALLEQIFGSADATILDDALRTRPIDFPMGIGAKAAKIFGIDPDIPTEVKRTIDSGSRGKAVEEFQRYFRQQYGIPDPEKEAVKLAGGGSVKLYHGSNSGPDDSVLNNFKENGILSNMASGYGQGSGFFMWSDRNSAVNHAKTLIDPNSNMTTSAKTGGRPMVVEATEVLNPKNWDLDYELQSKNVVDYIYANFDSLKPLLEKSQGVDLGDGLKNFQLRNKINEYVDPNDNTTMRKVQIGFNENDKDIRRTLANTTGDLRTGQVVSKLVQALRMGDPDVLDSFESDFFSNLQPGTALKYVGSSPLKPSNIETFAYGGRAGISPEDTVPALLTPGEFVINKRAAQKIGYTELGKLNQADKIQGFNKGGAVGGVIQKFAAGGDVLSILLKGLQSFNQPAVQKLQSRPSETSSATVEVSSEISSFSKNLVDELDKAGYSMKSLNNIIAQLGKGADISYKQMEKALEKDVQRLKISGASIEVTTKAEKALADVRNQSKTNIVKRQFLEAGFKESKVGKALGPGASQQKILMEAEAKEKLIIEQRRKELTQSVSSIPGGSGPPLSLDKIKEKVQELLDAEAQKIKELAFIGATQQVTGIKKSELSGMDISGVDIQGYVSQSMTDRKTLAQMDKQLIAGKIEELKNSSDYKSASNAEQRKLLNETMSLANEEVSKRRQIINEMAKEDGSKGVGAAGLTDFRNSPVLNAVKDRYFDSDSGKFKGSTALGDVGMVAGLVGGQGENIANQMYDTRTDSGKVQAAKTSVAIQNAGSTLATGLTTAAQLAPTSPLAAALVAVGTAAYAAADSYYDFTGAQEEAAAAMEKSIRADKIAYATDMLNKSFEALMKSTTDLGLKMDYASKAKTLIDLTTEDTNIETTKSRQDQERRTWTQWYKGGGPLADIGQAMGISSGNVYAKEGTNGLELKDYQRLGLKQSEAFSSLGNQGYQLLSEAYKQGFSREDIIKNMDLSGEDNKTGITRDQVKAMVLSDPNKGFQYQVARSRGEAAGDRYLKEETDNFFNTNAQALAAEKAQQMARALELADKAGRRLADSFELLSKNINEAIGRITFESEARTEAMKQNSDALRGKSESSGPKLKELNVLNNPSAYDDKEYDDALSAATSGITNDRVKQQIIGGSQLEQRLPKAIKEAISTKLKGNASLGIDEAKELAIKAANSEIDKLNLQPEQKEDLKTIAKTKIDKQAEASREAFTSQGEKAVVDNFLESLNSSKDITGDFSSKMSEAAKELLSFRQGALKEFAEGLNTSSKALKESEIYFKKARDIRNSGNMNLREVMTGVGETFDEKQSRVMGDVSSLTGGVTDVNAIKNRMLSLQTSRKNIVTAQGATGGDPAAAAKLEENLRAVDDKLRDTAEALDILADTTELVEKAFNDLKNVRELQKNRESFVNQLLTNTPDEADKLNQTFIRLQRNLSGGLNDASNQRDARKAFNQTLRETGSVREATKAGNTVLANQRKETLAAMNDPGFQAAQELNIRNQYANANMPGADQAVADYFKNQQLQVMKSMAIESGMINNPLVRQAIAAKENPDTADPAMVKAADRYLEAVGLQSDATKAKGDLAVIESQQILKASNDNLTMSINDLNARIDTLILGDAGVPNNVVGTDSASEKVVQLASRGGLMYAQQGQYVNFQPKGTDTIPAMLTPGEFVINARSTSEHLPLLKAINSGNYSKGGVVYLADGGKVRTRADVQGKLDAERDEATQINRNIESRTQSYNSSDSKERASDEETGRQLVDAEINAGTRNFVALTLDSASGNWSTDEDRNAYVTDSAANRARIRLENNTDMTTGRVGGAWDKLDDKQKQELIDKEKEGVNSIIKDYSENPGNYKDTSEATTEARDARIDHSGTMRGKRKRYSTLEERQRLDQIDMNENQRYALQANMGDASATTDRSIINDLDLVENKPNSINVGRMTSNAVNDTYRAAGIPEEAIGYSPGGSFQYIENGVNWTERMSAEQAKPDFEARAQANMVIIEERERKLAADRLKAQNVSANTNSQPMPVENPAKNARETAEVRTKETQVIKNDIKPDMSYTTSVIQPSLPVPLVKIDTIPYGRGAALKIRPDEQMIEERRNKIADRNRRMALNAIHPDKRTPDQQSRLNALMETQPNREEGRLRAIGSDKRTKEENETYETLREKRLAESSTVSPSARAGYAKVEERSMERARREAGLPRPGMYTQQSRVPRSKKDIDPNNRLHVLWGKGSKNRSSSEQDEYNGLLKGDTSSAISSNPATEQRKVTETAATERKMAEDQTKATNQPVGPTTNDPIRGNAGENQTAYTSARVSAEEQRATAETQQSNIPQSSVVEPTANQTAQTEAAASISVSPGLLEVINTATSSDGRSRDSALSAIDNTRKSIAKREQILAQEQQFDAEFQQLTESGKWREEHRDEYKKQRREQVVNEQNKAKLDSQTAEIDTRFNKFLAEGKVKENQREQYRTEQRSYMPKPIMESMNFYNVPTAEQIEQDQVNSAALAQFDQQQQTTAAEKVRAQQQKAEEDRQASLYINSSNPATAALGYVGGVSQGVLDSLYGGVNIVGGGVATVASPIVGGIGYAMSGDSTAFQIGDENNLRNRTAENMYDEARANGRPMPSPQEIAAAQDAAVIRSRGFIENSNRLNNQPGAYSAATRAAAEVGVNAMGAGAMSFVEAGQAVAGMGPIQTGEQTALQRNDARNVELAGGMDSYLGFATAGFQTAAYLNTAAAGALVNAEGAVFNAAGRAISSGARMAGRVVPGAAGAGRVAGRVAGTVDRAITGAARGAGRLGGRIPGASGAGRAVNNFVEGVQDVATQMGDVIGVRGIAPDWAGPRVKPTTQYAPTNTAASAASAKNAKQGTIYVKPRPGQTQTRLGYDPAVNASPQKSSTVYVKPKDGQVPDATPPGSGSVDDSLRTKAKADADAKAKLDASKSQTESVNKARVDAEASAKAKSDAAVKAKADAAKIQDDAAAKTKAKEAAKAQQDAANKAKADAAVAKADAKTSTGPSKAAKTSSSIDSAKEMSKEEFLSKLSSKESSAYDILGVQPGTSLTSQEVRDLVRKYNKFTHPDLGGSAELQARLNKIVELASDPDSLSQYDMILKNGIRLKDGTIVRPSPDRLLSVWKTKKVKGQVVPFAQSSFADLAPAGTKAKSTASTATATQSTKKAPSKAELREQNRTSVRSSRQAERQSLAKMQKAELESMTPSQRAQMQAAREARLKPTPSSSTKPKTSAVPTAERPKSSFDSLQEGVEAQRKKQQQLLADKSQLESINTKILSLQSQEKKGFFGFGKVSKADEIETLQNQKRILGAKISKQEMMDSSFKEFLQLSNSPASKYYQNSDKEWKRILEGGINNEFRTYGLPNEVLANLDPDAGIFGQLRGSYARSRGIKISDSAANYSGFEGVEFNKAGVRVKDYNLASSLRDKNPERFSNFAKSGETFYGLTPEGGVRIFGKDSTGRPTATLYNIPADEVDKLNIIKKLEALNMPKFNQGGIVYANNGALVPYLSQGTDTVPAMLTPGEFVVNRESSQKHMPILQAINNGYFNRGGIVNYLANGGAVMPQYSANGGPAKTGGGVSKDAASSSVGDALSAAVKSAVNDFNNSIQKGMESYSSMMQSSVEKMNSFGQTFSSATQTLANSAGTYSEAANTMPNSLTAQIAGTQQVNITGLGAEGEKIISGASNAGALAGRQTSQSTIAQYDRTQLDGGLNTAANNRPIIGRA